LASAVPPPRKPRVFAAPVLDPVKPLIDAMLRQDMDAPKKQRHTARRILARLVDEHGVETISYSTVRGYVARRRPEIVAEANRPLEEGCVPQCHDPAAEAEVDFHDLWVILRGVKTKTALFTMRLSFSGRAVHRAFATQGQEAFLEGHVYAFDRLGGVPTDKIRYDNLKCAVSRVLFGRTRTETQRWVTFRSAYGFDAFYCQPGQEGSHEKGGVEGEGGRFRRTHCVPMPVVDSIEELNALLAAADDADDARRIAHRTHTVGHDWAIEKSLLRPLPDEPLDTALTLTPRVDRFARVMVRCNQYSVPARLIGHRVRHTLASKLVNELVEAADERQLSKLIARYGRVDLILIDELGYLELDRRGAELLFPVLTEREERSAVAIASNEPFSRWTKTFTDPRLCAAVVDRLTFAGQIIQTGTVSYRLAHARQQQNAKKAASTPAR
jgi:transposase